MPMMSAEPRNFSLLFKAHRAQQGDLTPQTISDMECASISTLPGSSRKFEGDALSLFTEIPRRGVLGNSEFVRARERAGVRFVRGSG